MGSRGRRSLVGGKGAKPPSRRLFFLGGGGGFVGLEGGRGDRILLEEFLEGGDSAGATEDFTEDRADIFAFEEADQVHILGDFGEHDLVTESGHRLDELGLDRLMLGDDGIGLSFEKFDFEFAEGGEVGAFFVVEELACRGLGLGFFGLEAEGGFLGDLILLDLGFEAGKLAFGGEFFLEAAHLFALFDRKDADLVVELLDDLFEIAIALFLPTLEREFFLFEDIAEFERVEFFLGFAIPDLKGDGLGLHLMHDLGDLGVEDHGGEDFDFVDIHAIFGEEAAWSGSIGGFFTEDSVAEELGDLGPKFHEGHRTAATSDEGTHMIDEDLDIVFVGEPTVFSFGFEGDGVADIDIDLDEVFGFYGDRVGDPIARGAEERGFEESIVGLGSAHREMKADEFFFIFEEFDTRAFDHALAFGGGGEGGVVVGDLDRESPRRGDRLGSLFVRLALGDPEIPFADRDAAGDMDFFARIDEIRAFASDETGFSGFEVADVDPALLVDPDGFDEDIFVIIADHGLPGVGGEDFDLIERKEEGIGPVKEEFIAGFVEFFVEGDAFGEFGFEFVTGEAGDDPKPQGAVGEEFVGIIDAVSGAFDEEGVVRAGEDAGRADFDLAFAVGVDDDAKLFLA